MPRNVAVLGATSPIGASTLQAIARHPERFRASVLVAHDDAQALTDLCVLHRPDLAIIADPALETELSRRLAAAGAGCHVASGHDAVTLAAASTRCDTVVAALTGIAGLDASLAATKAGKRVLLTHRATSVIAGPLLLQALAEGGGALIPVDIERNAICPYPPSEHAGGNRGGLRKLVLTTSGGPFRGRPRAELMAITPEQLCRHAKTGEDRRALVDSASLMNAGLAIIEAQHLSRLPPDHIEVQLQPQSQLHSLSAYADGSILTRVGKPDLPTAIACALTWPESIDSDSAANPPDLANDADADTGQPDTKTFRCLALARQALEAGGDAPTLLNAANDVAVAAFLAGALPFLSIADVIEQVLTELPPQAVVDIQTLSERDRTAREAARQVLRNAC